MRRFHLAILAAVLGAFVLGAGASLAQDDHLQCFKVKDDVKIKGYVDLDSPQLGLDPECKVKSAELFCVPTAKEVIEVVDKRAKEPLEPLDVRPPVLPYQQGAAGGGFLPGVGVDRICYRVKCDKRDISIPQVADQFGVHQFKVKKDFLVCTPAVKGEPPVTEDVPCDADFFDVWQFTFSDGDHVRVWANTIDAEGASDLRLYPLSCPGLIYSDDDFSCTFPPNYSGCPLDAFDARGDGTCTLAVGVASDFEGNCPESGPATYTLGVEINGVSVRPTLEADDTD